MACADSPFCGPDCPDCDWRPIATMTFGPGLDDLLEDPRALGDVVALMMLGGNAGPPPERPGT